MARPPKYAREEDKPVSVTLRLPRDLYDQAQQHAKRRQTTLTELVREGLQLRLETPTDPRDILATQDSTVMQELRQMIADEVQAALAAQRERAPAQPPSDIAHDENTVLHETHTQAKPADARDEHLPFDTDSAPARVFLEASTVELTYDSNAVLPKRKKPTPAKGQSQGFDRDKFHLGALCNRKHEYGQTGKSLRRNHKNPNQRHCLECVRENNRAYVKNKARNKEKAST